MEVNFAIELFAEITKQANPKHVYFTIDDNSISVYDGYCTVNKEYDQKIFNFNDEDFIIKAVNFIKENKPYIRVLKDYEHCSTITEESFNMIMRKDTHPKERYKEVIDQLDCFAIWPHGQESIAIDSSWDPDDWNSLMQLYSDINK